MEYINFRRTDDKNIVLVDNISRDEQIHIDKLEKQIATIQNEIDNISVLIPTEGIRNEQILALIAEYNAEILDKTELEKTKKDKEDILLKCKTTEKRK